MKYIPLLFFLLHCLPSIGQKFTTQAGDFMDTTLVLNSNCSNEAFYYYSVNGKYPKSSSTLLKEAQNFLKKENASYTGSGYITFHFIIDCEGKPLQQVRVSQTDEQYQPYAFNKQLVQELYQYYKTLDGWKVGKLQSGLPVNYFAFVSFKVKNGKVVAINP